MLDLFRLAGMLKERKIYAFPLKRRDYIGDVHGDEALSHLAIEYIAQGGGYWPPNEGYISSNGVCRDIVSRHNHRGGFLLSDRPWIQAFAKIAIFDGSQECFDDISAIVRRMGKDVLIPRMTDGDGLLELLLRCKDNRTDDLAWCAFSALDSVVIAFDKVDKSALEFLADLTIIKWLTWDQEKIDERMISEAIECELAPGKLKRHLLRSWISKKNSDDGDQSLALKG